MERGDIGAKHYLACSGLCFCTAMFKYSHNITLCVAYCLSCQFSKVAAYRHIETYKLFVYELYGPPHTRCAYAFQCCFNDGHVVQPLSGFCHA